MSQDTDGSRRLDAPDEHPRSETSTEGVGAKPTRGKGRFAAKVLAAFLLVYFGVAYILAPILWKRYERRHPGFEDAPRITRAGGDIPGDPLNVALVGAERNLKRIMVAAKWYPADPLTLKSCLEIAEASVLERPYATAPVSNLYLWGRKEDLAFEKPVGNDPRRRHHVRFWKSESVDEAGRVLWLGAVTYDDRVGLSHTTGQITHHIAPDVDAERDSLLNDLKRIGDLVEDYLVNDFHTRREGRNGGGDPWRTDGALAVGVLKP